LLNISADVDKLTYSALPHDNGIGEGSWSGLCFCPNQWSTVSTLVQLMVVPFTELILENP